MTATPVESSERAPEGMETSVPVRILTVCSGNVCRSPLAEALLRRELAGLDVVVDSAGTIATDDATMPDEAQRLAVQCGVAREDASAHRARYLDPAVLEGASLVVAMGREHRRRVVELMPRLLRSTFTAREFARLAEGADDATLRGAASAAGTDPRARVAAVIESVVGRRGVVLPAESPDDDDVVDPFGRSWETYELSAEQLVPAIGQVARVVRAGLTP